MSPSEKKMGAAVMEEANPEFQVASKKWAGGQLRWYKRCSVFSEKRARDEGRRWR